MFDYTEYKQNRYIQKANWTQSQANESLYRMYHSIYANEVIDLVAWNFARQDCIDNAIESCNGFGRSDYMIGSCYLGTVFSIMPSGKFWTFWACSNVSNIEMIKDRAFLDALNAEAESRNMWIENSEYDPCDLLVYCFVDIEG